MNEPGLRETLQLIGLMIQFIVMPLLGIIGWQFRTSVREMRAELTGWITKVESRQEQFVTRELYDRANEATVKQIELMVANVQTRLDGAGGSVLRRELNELRERVAQIEATACNHKEES